MRYAPRTELADVIRGGDLHGAPADAIGIGREEGLDVAPVDGHAALAAEALADGLDVPQIERRHRSHETHGGFADFLIRLLKPTLVSP